jgi:ribonuclease R
VAKVEHSESHRLIEECMLAANEAVARLVRERQRPAVFRVHADPDQGKLFEFATLARSYGHEPGDLSNRRHLQRLLEEIRGLPHEHALKLGLLKSLQRAAYGAEPLGHYGLAKTDYCHFTSPIRRYADLLVHRALQPLLVNPPPVAAATLSYAALGEVARHLSDTERNSAEAEEETRQLKLLEYLEAAAGAVPPPLFEGVVTDVRVTGLLVEALDIATRGMVKRADLPRGDWRFDATRMRYVERGGRELRLGARLWLAVQAVDVARGFVDFRLAGG